MRFFLLLLLTLALWTACTSDKPETATETAQAAPKAMDIPTDRMALLNGINELRQKVYNQQTNQFDKTASGRYIAYIEQYAKTASDDPQAVNFLFQGAETARSIRAYTKALAIYDLIYHKFNTHPKHAQALFLKAFTYDNDMNQPDRARPIYEEFMTKHPEDEFADDTKFLLENLGKSDEEIIKKFEQ